MLDLTFSKAEKHKEGDTASCLSTDTASPSGMYDQRSGVFMLLCEYPPPASANTLIFRRLNPFIGRYISRACARAHAYTLQI